MSTQNMDRQPFIVVGAQRTGSTLLVGLLDSHPHIVTGGEALNPKAVEEGYISWPRAEVREDAALLDLRRHHPAAFIDRLFSVGGAAAHRAVGFKFMYDHGTRQPEALEHLRTIEGLRVIHIRRRNLLRRLLSHERARQSGEWTVRVGQSGAAEPPKVVLGARACAKDFEYMEAKAAEYDRLFAHRAVHHVVYEELAASPAEVAGDAIRFLGLDPTADLAVRLRKQSPPMPLADSIENFRELQRHFVEDVGVPRWAAFFAD